MTSQPTKLCNGLITHGYSRNLIQHSLINEFYLAPEITDILSEYYILHWDTTYTLLKAHEGIIYREGKQFIVVYNGCTRYKCKMSKKCVLSFRIPPVEYQLPNYVLIKPSTQM